MPYAFGQNSSVSTLKIQHKAGSPPISRYSIYKFLEKKGSSNQPTTTCVLGGQAITLIYFTTNYFWRTHTIIPSLT